MVIERSGLYSDSKGQPFLLTQGSIGYTLVAGKQCLFRIFMSPNSLNMVDSVVVQIQRVGNKLPRAIIVPKAYLIFVNDFPNGPSVGLIIRGFVFPKSDQYTVTFSLRSNQGAEIQQLSTDILAFKPTQDLRLLIIPIIHPKTNFIVTQEWIDDIERSMQRLGSMLPVRDCVDNKLSHSAHGLRYYIGEAVEGWPNLVGGPDPNNPDGLAELRQINSKKGKVDHIDSTVIYRPVQPLLNEAPGGNGTYCGPTANERITRVVAGNWNGIEATAPAIAQEMGHNFCLEPPGSPHYQDPNNPLHSKDPQIFDPFAYDFVNNRTYYPPSPPAVFLGDPMNNLGGGWEQGADSVLYNSYDWEFLRAKFMSLTDNVTGTEINPVYYDPCAITIPIPRDDPIPPFIFTNPEKYNQIIGSRADGSYWVFTPTGIKPCPPPRPDQKYLYQSEGLRIILDELHHKGIDHANIPIGDESLTMVKNPSMYISLHGSSEFQVPPEEI